MSDDDNVIRIAPEEPPRPFYRSWWWYVVLVLVGLGAASVGGFGVLTLLKVAGLW